MLLMVLAACACGSALLWAALVVGGPGRRRRDSAVSGLAGAAALTQPAVAAGQVADVAFAGREEDRIRPAVDGTGTRVWVSEEDLLWHEIVCWPPRQAPRPDMPLRFDNLPG